MALYLLVEFTSKERAPLDILAKIKEMFDYEVRQDGIEEYALYIISKADAEKLDLAQDFTVIAHKQKEKTA